MKKKFFTENGLVNVKTKAYNEFYILDIVYEQQPPDCKDNQLPIMYIKLLLLNRY